MLVVEQLSLSLAGRWLFRELSFDARAGERWAILGPNGCGKTSLLTCLAGLRRAHHGQVLLKDHDITHMPLRDLACLRSYTTQIEHDVFSLPSIQRVLAARQPFSTGWGWENATDLREARHWLTMFDLAGREDQDVLTLSGGERQRLALAAAFAQGAPLMLLDEPTAHLDVPHAQAFFQQLEQHPHICALLALHDLNLALRYCTHALLFTPGELQIGTVDTLLRPATLHQAFGHAFREFHDGTQRWLVSA